uniref:Signal transducer and activator of transcription 6, interleukin-4 induced n=1 Tax=Scleropages formosus TaxID=113540 RepID=A0A8C9TZH0_SCLFO
MAQWDKVKCLPTQVLSELYPSQFPMEVRYYLASWIEEQHWEDFNVDDTAQESQALQLLEQIVSFLQDMSQQNSNVVERLRLQHIAVNMVCDSQTSQGPIHANTPCMSKCEQLLGVNVKIREEVVLAAQECGGAEPVRKLQERLERLFQTLIQSSLIVDKQPPQIIKTQSKFSTSVRFLLGEKVAPGRPALLKAQIVTEAQARNLVQLVAIPTDNVGELVSHTALLDYNSSNKTTCATFKNMCIKKIKRADRRGSESVTEEKFAIHFSGEISLVGFDSPCRVQALSVPIVVIVHGSQDINAMATIIWDCAFSDPDRVPFVVPDRVPWKQMCMTLESKFMSEVKTQRGLDIYNQHFLAQKIFNKPDYSGDFSNMLVTWSQFNKEMLPGRAFTFWQWFEGVLELTKKHLQNYWSDNLIFGFIGKQHLHLILQDRPNGTFLLRFSDSEIGGITIAYIAPSESESQISSLSPRRIWRSGPWAIAFETLRRSRICTPNFRKTTCSKSTTRVRKVVMRVFQISCFPTVLLHKGQLVSVAVRAIAFGPKVHRFRFNLQL